MSKYKIVCPFCGKSMQVPNNDTALCENDNCRAMIGISVQPLNNDGFAFGQIIGTGVYRFETTEDDS